MRIIYIDIDSLNPSHLGCYGYHRNTSPTIDSIAAEGIRFTQCYASDAPCLPSRTAFYTGRFGIQTGVVGHGGTAAQPRVEGADRNFRDSLASDGLAARLQQCGLHTAMISPFGQRHSAHWFYAGFNEFHNTGKGGMESAEEIQPVVDRWLNDNAAKDNWYLHINYWDPHTPYRVPLAYGTPFADDPLPDWLDDDDLIARHVKMTGPHSALDQYLGDESDLAGFPRQPLRITNRSSMRQQIDGYDTGIRYCDDHLAQIVQRLKDMNLWHDTVMIVSADHGENQGELGIYGEHGTTDVGTCRIPLIIRWPGADKGRVDDELRYNLDLAPTLVDMLGAKPSEIWDGSSYAKLFRGIQSPGRDDIIISQCAHVCQRSVRWGDWLYMRTYHDGFQLFPQEMLYNLRQDNHEQHDVAVVNPERCREGAWRLARWHDAQMQKLAVYCSDVTDPLWTVIREGGPLHAKHAGKNTLLKTYIERLEATGRPDGAAELKQRYARWI